MFRWPPFSPQHIVVGLLNSHPWVCRCRCWILPFPTPPCRRDPCCCCYYNSLTPPHIWKSKNSWFQSNQSWFQSNQSWFQSNQSWFQSQNTMFQNFIQNVFIHFIIFHIIKVSFWAVQPTSYGHNFTRIHVEASKVLIYGLEWSLVYDCWKEMSDFKK